MKVIDELIKYANGEPLLRKAELDTGRIFEYNGKSIIEQIIEYYGICKHLLNAELKPIEEDTFEDIEEITYKPRKVQNAINQLIRNQKKIISKLDKEQ